MKRVGGTCRIAKLSTAFDVAPVVKGEVLVGHIDGLPELSMRIV